MTTPFLNDLDLQNAPTDPNFLPEGKYPAFLYDLKIKDIQKNNTRALIISYKISDLDSENQGKTKTEFKTLPKMENGVYADDDSKRNAAFLKQRLLSLGVPESELNDMKREDLLGTPVWITIKQVKEYYNISAVELRETESSVGMM